MNRRFGRSGEIRDVDVLAAFVGLWKDRASVKLDFTRAGVSAGCDIADGEVVSTFSTDPRFETAAILVRSGKLDAAALERLAAPEGSDRAMAAMQAGVLTRREWKWGEKIRAIEVVSDLLTWNEGRYLVEPDTRSAAGEFRLPIPRLLLELFLRSRDRVLVEHQLGDPDAPLGRSEDFDAEFATFGLTADAESVVRLIDGRASAREIASRAPAEAFAVEKLLAALVTLELLHPGTSASGAAPAEAGAAASGIAKTGSPEPPEEGLDAEFARAEEAPAAGGAFPALRDFSESPPDLREGVAELPYGRGALDAAEALETQDLGVSEQAAREDAPAPSSWDTLAPGPPDQVLTKVVETAEEPARRSQGPILAGILALLVVAVAAVLFVRSRTGAEKTAAVQPERTAPVAAAPTQAPLPTEVPAATPPVPTAKPVAVKPIRAAATTRPTAPASPVRPAPQGAAGAVRKPWVDRAESGRKRLAAEPNTRFAVQLLLACEVSTLEDAFRHEMPAGSMWILATDHKGKSCFRVLWGRFATADEARRAKERVPAHFVSSSNKPAVVAVR